MKTHLKKITVSVLVAASGLFFLFNSFTASALTASDNFNRPNGSVGSNWTVSGALGIASNILALTGNTDSWMSWNINNFGNDHYSQATVVTTTTNDNHAVAVRMAVTGAKTFYFCDSGRIHYIGKFVGGVHTILKTVAVTIHAGDVLRCEAQGNVIRYVLNGTTIDSVTDNSVTSGRVGFFISTNDGQFDDWSGGDLVSAPPDTAPPVISSIATSSVTQTGATITWTTDDNSDSQADYGVTNAYGSSSLLNISLVTSHSTDLSSLTPGITYHYRVRSKDTAGNLGISTDNTFTTLSPLTPDTIPPSTPTNLQLSNITSNSISLSWTASTDTVGVVGYRLFRNGVQVATTSAITFSDTNLASSTNYSYTVSAYDAAGNNSVQSSSANATTQGSAPSNPPAFVTEAHYAADCPGGLQCNNASVSLNVSGTNNILIASFHTEWDGVGITLDSVSPDSWSITDNGVPGTSLVQTNGYTGNDGNRRFRIYYWINPAAGINTVSVANPNSGQNELSISTVLLTNVSQTSPLGSPVINVSTTPRTGESETATSTTNDLIVHVIGDALATRGTLAAGETSRSVANDGQHSALGDGDASVWIATKPGVNGNTTVSSSGWASGPSPSPRILNGVAVVVHGTGSGAADTAAPTVPSNLQATNISANSVTISWNASTDNVAVAGYHVFRNGSLVGTTTQTSYNALGLAALTSYSFTVQAYDGANNVSGSSQALNVTTTNSPLTTPAFVKLTEGRETTSSNSISTSNFSSPVTTGNLIVAWVWYNSTGQSVSSVADSVGNTYIKAVGPTTGTGTMSGWRQELWYAKNSVGGSGISVTAMFTGTFNAEKSITAHEYSGLDPVSPLDATAAEATSAANASSGSVSTKFARELIFGASLFQGSGTAGIGFTQRSSIAGNASEDKVVSIVGSYSATFSNSAQNAIVQLAAFRASGQ